MSLLVHRLAPGFVRYCLRTAHWLLFFSLVHLRTSLLALSHLHLRPEGSRVRTTCRRYKADEAWPTLARPYLSPLTWCAMHDQRIPILVVAARTL